MYDDALARLFVRYRLPSGCWTFNFEVKTPTLSGWEDDDATYLYIRAHSYMYMRYMYTYTSLLDDERCAMGCVCSFFFFSHSYSFWSYIFGYFSEGDGWWLHSGPAVDVRKGIVAGFFFLYTGYTRLVYTLRMENKLRLSSTLHYLLSLSLACTHLQVQLEQLVGVYPPASLDVCPLSYNALLVCTSFGVASD